MSHLGHYVLGVAAIGGAVFLVARGELARRSGRAPDVPDMRLQPRTPSVPSASAPAGARVSDAMTGAALLSLGAGLIHAFVVREHFEETSLFGTFFVVLSALQAGWAVALVWRPSRRLLVAGAIGSVLVATLWLVSRTVGLPVGPERWEAERIGLADAVATTFELGAAALAVVALRSRSPLSFLRPLLARTLPAVTAGAVIGLTYLAVATGGHR